MKDDHFIIHVNVGGFRLPLNILREDEEIYRKAEKEVNTLLTKFQQKYNQRSAEEVLSLTAYHLAVALQKKEFSLDASPVISRIKKMDEELEQLLSD